jgi:hypothetical protein
MKRYNRLRPDLKSCLLILILGLLLPLVFTDTARAERSFDLKQIVVEAKALPDASMQVTERLTVDFSGQWNGFYISIPRGDSPVTEVAVSENGRPYEFNSGSQYGPRHFPG